MRCLRHAVGLTVLWMGLGMGLALGAGCGLFSAEVACDDDSQCPASQICGSRKVCEDGTRDDVDAGAPIDSGHGGTDGGGRDSAGGQDTWQPSVDAAGRDTAVGTDANGSHDAATRDSATPPVDAGIAATCESAPCNFMPDSPHGFCRDTTNLILSQCPTSGQSLYGQDGNFFSPRPAYRDQGNGTVEDLLTGLEWEQSPPTATQRYHLDAEDYCSNLQQGGHDDWRLPEYLELVTLVDYGRAYPDAPIDTTYFPPPLRDVYFTATGRGTSFFWYFDAWAGTPCLSFDDLQGTSCGDAGAVRCVRGGPWVGNAFRFTAGSYVNTRTGLTWEATPDATRMRWSDALSYCAALTTGGHDDWRLPSVKELITLIDHSRTSGAAVWSEFDATVDTNYDSFWTSSPDASSSMNPGRVWVVRMYTGQESTSSFDSGTLLKVRCVRGL